jgi:ankyrin repeat protein
LTSSDYTLEEYLDRTRDDRYPNASDDVLATCITYLSYRDVCWGPCKGRRELESRLSRNPFLEYVACYWGYHALGSTDPNIQDALLNFLIDESAVSSCGQLTFLAYWDQEEPERMTGMHLAAHFGLTAMIQRLLEKGVAADSSGWLRRTPLSMAAQRGFIFTVGLLLERQDVNIDSRDSLGLTPLHYAAMSGSFSVAKLLIAKGAAIDRRNIRGQTPLHLAAEDGYENIAQMLIDAGSDVNALSDTETTPLFRAARRGHVSVIQRLLAAKANVDLITYDGYSPLRTAVGYNQTGVVEELLTARPDLDIVDVDGRTPLEVARWLRNNDIVRNNDTIRMLENAALEREQLSLMAS